MAPREDLVNSAVAFLQDPSVAAAPLDKRKAFLESKNLTAEEIELALARAGEDSSIQHAYAAGQASYQSPPQQRAPPPPGYGYNYSQYPGPWPQPMQEPPRRDWRDWFIMATVTTGVSYGLYTLAKRYVAPLITPPTPPQIEQDKAAIDAEFTRAFALIDQLASDTAALKTAETERTEKLDDAIEHMKQAVENIKSDNRHRLDDAKALRDEVHLLKDLIPKALDGWKSDGDNRLKDLNNELRSLKTLVGNRVGAAVPQSPAVRPGAGATGGVSTPAVAQSSSASAGMGKAPPAPTAVPEKEEQSATGPDDDGAAALAALKKDAGSPFSFEGRPGQRAIPAWQMAAAGKSGAGSSANAGSSDTATGA